MPNWQVIFVSVIFPVIMFAGGGLVFFLVTKR